MDSRNYTLVIAAKTLFRDEEGFVITIELILIATIVGIGSIVGLTTLRNAINSELADVSAAIESLELGGNGNNGNGNNGNGNGNGNNGNGNNANSCISFSTPPADEA